MATVPNEFKIKSVILHSFCSVIVKLLHMANEMKRNCYYLFAAQAESSQETRFGCEKRRDNEIKS